MGQWAEALIAGHGPLGIAAVAALIMLSGLFSAAEAALLSLGPAGLAGLTEKRVVAAPAIKKLLSDPRRLMAALALGSDMAGLAAAVLVAAIVAFRVRDWEWLTWLKPGPARELLPGLIIAFVLVAVAGQAVPRVLGARGPAFFSRLLAYPILAFMKPAAPVSALARAASEAFLGALGASPEDGGEDLLGEERIKELVEAGSRQGLLDVTERELLVNLLKSGEVTAGDIMTPRHEIVSISADAAKGEARSLFLAQDYSRIPVFEGDREHYVGVLTAKDLLKLRLSEAKGKPLSIREAMRPPLLVPESRRIRDLLLDFKSRRLHLALVVDEFGAVAGLVTMEDVLEEIFGEVREEEDEAEFEDLGGGRWRVAGGLEIAEFNARAGVKISGAGARTMAGFVLSLLGRRPRPGDETRAHGLLFRVLEVRGIIINRLEVRRGEAP
ncbi:MAG TPA: hemolysin family protein [bacterium]|nr:hemolysin family protein [bacterium]